MTTNKARLAGLDTLRAIAILAVMGFHFYSFLPERFASVVQHGWMGVDLFFVLSGYLIGGQLLKPCASGGRPAILTFYRRRAWRILPAYWVVLLLYATVPGWREAPALPPVWEFATFTQNLLMHAIAFSHAWSLCVEEHFYLLLPLLTLALLHKPSLRKTVLVLAALLLLGILLRSYVLVHVLRPLAGSDDEGTAFIRRLYYPTWNRLDGLLDGVALALVRLFRPSWWRVLARRGHATFGAGLLLLAASVWLFHDRSTPSGLGAWSMVIGFPVLSLALALLVCSAVSDRGLLSRVRVPGAQLVATLAFSLYLTHKAVAHLDQAYLPRLTAPRGAAACLVYAVSCLAVAGLLHVAVERPCLAWRDRGHRAVTPAAELDLSVRDEPAL